MPEDTTIGPDLERVLEQLDDFALNAQNYQTIQDAIEKSQGNIKVAVFEKLLNICVYDLKEDVKNTVNKLNVIVAVLKKIQIEEFQQLPDLVPSAIAILQIIKTTALLNNVDRLKMLCFEIILSYPNDTLTTLAVSHYNEIMEMVNLYNNQRIPLDMRLQSMNIIFKLLNILPPDKRTLFVRDGIGIWFSKIVPTVMAFATSGNIKNTMPIETMEMLTEELVASDYANNPNWQTVLQCVYTPQKYPAIMKNLLDNGSDIWYRLWIVFIKLLKSQITKSSNSIGSPINSMLPVVESAFKMNVKNRCRAFLCWNVLIDNFSTETNEVYINKRLKLLIIPLTSNNAKVEETALAKLNTWWHLIRQFETKIKNSFDTVILPFLYFCFGKPAVPEKPVFAPGLLTINTKRQVLQALANIAGHVNCDCTVNMAKLNSKILSSNLLVEYWKNWTYALTMTIRICVNDNSDSATQHFKCIWKSFIATIAEVADCNIRHNLFVELLTILEVLLQSPRCEKLADLIFNIVTNSILDHNDKVQPLFIAENEESDAIHKIVSLILNPSLDYVFTRYDAKEIVIKIKPLTKFIAEEYLNQMVEGYLKKPLLKNNSLMLWTALSESICELKCDISMEILHTMLLLPLKSMSLFTSVEISASAWLLLYNYTRSKLNESSSADGEICEMMSDRTITSTANKHFIFRASLALLNSRMTSSNENLIWKITETLLCITNGIDCQFVEYDFESYVNTLILLLNKVTEVTDEKLAKTTILIINNLFKLLSKYYKQCDTDDQVSNFVIKLLEPLDLMLKKDVYIGLKSIVVDELKKCTPHLKHSGIDKNVLTIINNMLNHKMNKSEPVVSPIVISDEEVNATNLDDHNKFTAPVVKAIPKKGKKKDSNIIDTVVENGEEYVVVKSNWKFNPKKLTDNQKEKLHRTREDIPALYQDLSQSQDEFKRAFRTNSVDSSTGSKSTTTENEDASSILINMPCSNVFPRIIENILTESSKKESSDHKTTDSTLKSSHIEQKLTDIRSPKLPRVALKDRVFRNVRNLIEKSGLQIDEVELNSTVNENLLNTPPLKQQANSIVVNSAPSEINSERPSRIKRKPKKFDDLKLLSCKRRRKLVGQYDSQSFNNTVLEEPKIKDIEGNLDHGNILNADKSIEEALHIGNVDKDVEVTKYVKNISEQPAKNSETSETSKNCINKKDITEDKLNTGESERKDKSPLQLLSDSTCAVESLSDTDSCNLSDDKSLSTPNKLNKDINTPKRSNKKGGKRKSRIENELVIDMVEGHPFLKMQSEKRLTRKTVVDISPNVINRKKLVEKLDKSKRDVNKTKSEKKKDKDISNGSSNEKQNDSIEDFASLQSQDIIESSQDSTISTISVKATKKPKRIPVVALENLKDLPKGLSIIQNTLLIDTLNSEVKTIENREDIELPRNKTIVEDKVDFNLTENMDAVPAENNTSAGEVIEITNNERPIVINTDDTYRESEDTANAITQSLDSALLIEEPNSSNLQIELVVEQHTAVSENNIGEISQTPNIITETVENIQTFSEPLSTSPVKDINPDCSPFKDEEQRKQDFMNNTLEISPIKILSPVQEEKKSPTPETSSDFVVITLTSPVQSDGEPYDKSESPEIFSNDKISPDKRDQSPPRDELVINNLSPSSSLSLKKNRPQVRPGGRAAQMLGLCVPDRLQTIINLEKSIEPEENKRLMALNTSARRNLRILYNSTGENNEMCDENEDSDYFLKLKRSLPTIDSSPSGPILKRKHNDIIDETTISPACKRKRVSFHDPPVSTTICVKKYIEPSGIRSPQNSALKRQERQLRAQTNMKSPKRLDSVFKLENVLTKTVESFVENDKNMTNLDDSEMSSLEQTPIAEVVTTIDLNDTDPICSALLNCKDPIDNIATELSSPAMKLLLLREFEGKLETIGDLAKLTELQVNRLCIKSPKIQVAKRVLTDYASKTDILNQNEPSKTSTTVNSEFTVDSEVEEINSTIQVEKVLSDKPSEELIDMEINTQTQSSSTLAFTQTDSTPNNNDNGTQTMQTVEETTSSLIKSLSERPDFVSQLCEQLEDSSKQEIANKMSLCSITEVVLGKVNVSNLFGTVIALLEHHRTLISSEGGNSTQLSVLQNYLCDRFDDKDLILFCSEILRRVYEKSA